MNFLDPVPTVLRLDPSWAIPVVGGVITGVAYLLGRKMLLPASSLTLEPASDSMPFALHGFAKERRSAPRRQGNAIQVAIRSEKGGFPRRGWVLDRSTGGVRLLIEEPLPTGARLEVRPQNAPHTAPWTGILVRSCLSEQSAHQIGCQFTQTPSFNVLLLFG